MRFLIIFLAVILLAIIVLGVVIYFNSPEEVSDLGYFVITKNGVEDRFTKTRNAKLVWYSDGLCPDCHRVEEQIGTQLQELVKEGNLEIEYHPINFLGKYCIDDFCLRHAAWTLGVAKYAPDKIWDWLSLANTPESAPSEAYQSFEELRFYEIADKAGLTKEEIIIIDKNMNNLKRLVNIESVNIRENEELISISPKEKMFVPFMYLEGVNGKAFDGESEDTPDSILSPLLQYIELNCSDCTDE